MGARGPASPRPSGMVRGWRPALAGLAASPRLRGGEEPPQQGARPPGQGPGVAGRSEVGGRAAPGGGLWPPDGGMWVLGHLHRVEVVAGQGPTRSGVVRGVRGGSGGVVVWDDA